MNIYHITYSPETKIACLHFWGCSLDCRGCLLKKELCDCHLEETKRSVLDPAKKNALTPQRFLSLDDTQRILLKLEIKETVLMGAEAALDPELPPLTKFLHDSFGSHNVLLTNGFVIPDLEDIDEVVFSLKAYTDQLHRDYTGKGNENALGNFVRYCHSGVKLRTESVLIPGYIDCAEIDKISGFIGEHDSRIPYRIDAFIPFGDNPWRRPTLQEMENAVNVARKNLAQVTCLTGNETLKYEVLTVV